MREQSRKESRVAIFISRTEYDKEITTMGEYDEFIAEATAAAAAIRRKAEEREIKAQRATVPGLGG